MTCWIALLCEHVQPPRCVTCGNSLGGSPHAARLLPLQDTKIAAVCETAPGGLTGFPTWIIGGEQLVGEQSFEQLEAALARAQAATAAAPAPAS